MDVVETGSDFDVLKEGHAKHAENKHDEEEQETNIDQSREGHHQGEEQRPDTLGPFDETQDTADFGHAHHPQEGRRDEIFFYKVT